MAIRYYLCELVGDGTPGPGAWRPVIADALPGVAWTALDGRPAKGARAGWLLVSADTTDAQHGQILLETGVRYLPFETAEGAPLAPGDPISLIPPATRQTMRDRLEALGVPTQDFTLQTTMREVWLRARRRFLLRHRLGALDFTEGLDTLIRDIPSTRRANISARLTEAGFDTSVLANNITIREGLRRLVVQEVDVFRERVR